MFLFNLQIKLIDRSGLNLKKQQLWRSHPHHRVHPHLQRRLRHELCPRQVHQHRRVTPERVIWCLEQVQPQVFRLSHPLP